MKKKLIPITSALLTALSYLVPLGWKEMPEWVSYIARITFWVLLSATIILVIVMFWDAIPLRIRIEKHQRQQDENIRSLVFPYIRTINAYNAYFDDEAILLISVFFPTTITHSQKFKLRANLILNGHKSDWSQTEDIELTNRAVNRINTWELPLSQSMLDEVKIHIQEEKPMKAVLHIEDFNNSRIFWDTEEWTTLLLTRVN